MRTHLHIYSEYVPILFEHRTNLYRFPCYSFGWPNRRQGMQQQMARARSQSRRNHALSEEASEEAISRATGYRYPISPVEGLVSQIRHLSPQDTLTLL